MKKTSPHLTQRGSTLITSLMLLTLISILGLASATMSTLYTRVTHNTLITSQLSSQLVNTLNLAVSNVKNSTLNITSYINSSESGVLYQAANNQAWPSSHSLAGINEASHYIVEYLGCVPHFGVNSDACHQTSNTLPIHLYRITAKARLDTLTAYQQRMLKLAHSPTTQLNRVSAS